MANKFHKDCTKCEVNLFCLTELDFPAYYSKYCVHCGTWHVITAMGVRVVHEFCRWIDCGMIPSYKHGFTNLVEYFIESGPDQGWRYNDNINILSQRLGVYLCGSCLKLETARIRKETSHWVKI